ncbi:LexA family protein [Vibrio gangliei]|uniref:LexA family protein n=1 Tax=Vibrio gangliei TaxID=2077090 RepID=UPI000D022371|nr:translesion error-prone DNA polymerase V autoproteolytic subunit [Vibrio gangliei]
MKVIPIRASAGVSGFESPASEYTQLGLDLDALLIRHPNATFFSRVSGESMRDDGIFDDDILIVDRAVNVTNNSIIVANFNGEFVCKRIDTQRGLLLSSNQDFAPVAIHDLDAFSVEGVVICSIRCHLPVSWC